MDSRKMLFRVDAGGATGLGHFYRSLNLAKGLKKRGHVVQFIHRKSIFWDKQKDFEFDHKELKSDDEIQETSIILKNGEFDIFFVDGIIGFQEESFKEIKKIVKVVFYQNLSAAKYLADIYILPSIHQGADFFKDFDPRTKIFQGLEYFTFNEIIAATDPKKHEGLKKVKSVGIASGGSDPVNVLLRLYEVINHEQFSPIHFIYFTGENYMHSELLPSIHPPNVSFQKYEPNKILQTDLLISTFGVSTYELLYLGMPILSLGHQASNSLASKVVAERTKGIFHLGDINEINQNELNKDLHTFISDDFMRLELINNAKGMIDLKGISRVINILENEA